MKTEKKTHEIKKTRSTQLEQITVKWCGSFIYKN